MIPFYLFSYVSKLHSLLSYRDDLYSTYLNKRTSLSLTTSQCVVRIYIFAKLTLCRYAKNQKIYFSSPAKLCEKLWERKFTMSVLCTYGERGVECETCCWIVCWTPSSLYFVTDLFLRLQRNKKH